MRPLRRVELAAVAALSVACSQPAPATPPAPLEVFVRVESDPGKPLAGALVSVGGVPQATTGADGRARFALPGSEGDTVALQVKCPDTHASPARPMQIVLKRPDAGRTEYVALCPPLLRRVVLAVRAENGPNLPVKFFGKEVTRTDASGAAHYMVDARPGDQLELSISTNEKGAEALRPQNPVFSYVVRPQDEVVLFDARFQIDKPSAPGPSSRRGAGGHGIPSDR
jgi:hypothetical protein